MQKTEILSRINVKKVVLIGAILALLFIVELLFDVFEIGIGRLLWLTNPIRPQTGRLWDEDRKEQVGLSELDSVVQQETPADMSSHPIQNLEDLEALLSIRRSMSMNRQEFNDFYKSIPQTQSRRIIDPLDLFALSRGADWLKTQLSLSGNQLVFYFLDGYEKPIRESHVSLQDEEGMQTVTLSQLEQQDKFRGRLITADVFFQAFNRLPRSYQLQIVNDPYKLVQWESLLQRVGLSLYVEQNGVELIFEIQDDDHIRTQSMYASEMAVGYLIRELNAIEGAPQLQTPIRRDENAEEDY